MADDGERLVVLLSARIRDFEKNMQKASGTATNAYGKMRAGSKSATAAMEADMIRSTSRINQAFAATSTKIGSYGKTVAALLGGFTLARLVSEARQAIGSLGDLADAAALAGASAEKLQVLRQALAQNGGQAETADDALKAFNVRMGDLANTAGGPAADAVKTLGLSFSQLVALSPDDKFDAVVKKLAGVADPAQRAALAAELFGKSAGPEMAALLSQGNAVLSDTEARMRSLGTLMSNETVAAGDALDDKFQEWSTVIDSAFKGAVVGAADAIYDLIDSFRALEKQSSLRNLDAQLTALAAKRDTLNNTLIEIQDSNPAGAIIGPGKALVESQIADLKSQIEALDHEASAVLNRIGELNAQAKADRPTLGGTTVVIPQAKSTAPKDEGASFNIVPASVQDVTAAVDALGTSLRQTADTAQGFLSTFLSGLKSGKSFTDALADAVSNLTDKMLDAATNSFATAIFGGSGGGGLFSGLFGGGGSGLALGSLYADGGYVGGPGTGRSDSIPARLSNGEFVVNARATARHRQALEAINRAPGFANGGFVGNGPMSGGMGNFAFSPITNIAITGGTDQSTIAAFRAELDKRDARWERSLPGMLRKIQTNRIKG